DEAILLATFGGDEAKALGVVEPLHSAGRACHCNTPRCSCVVGVPELPVRTDPQLLVIALTKGRSKSRQRLSATRKSKRDPRCAKAPESITGTCSRDNAYVAGTKIGVEVGFGNGISLGKSPVGCFGGGRCHSFGRVPFDWRVPSLP